MDKEKVENKPPKEDELTIDNVLDSYRSKIEQYTEIQTEWIDDDDTVNKELEEKLEQ